VGTTRRKKSWNSSWADTEDKKHNQGIQGKKSRVVPTAEKGPSVCLRKNLFRGSARRGAWEQTLCKDAEIRAWCWREGGSLKLECCRKRRNETSGKRGGCSQITGFKGNQKRRALEKKKERLRRGSFGRGQRAFQERGMWHLRNAAAHLPQKLYSGNHEEVFTVQQKKGGGGWEKPQEKRNNSKQRKSVCRQNKNRLTPTVGRGTGLAAKVTYGRDSTSRSRARGLRSEKPSFGGLIKKKWAI